VSPPFVFLQQVKGLLRLDFAVAAQNCWVRKGGAFSGEIRFSSPSCFDQSCFSVVVEAVELSACPFGQIGSIASNVVGLSEEYSGMNFVPL
jgi:hypothetical protein